jgi:hypothetical protein
MPPPKITRPKSAQAELDRLFRGLMKAEQQVDVWRQRIVKFQQTDRVKITR